MDAVRLSRLTTAVVLCAVAGAAGHVLWPFAPGAGVLRPAAFAALMLGVGALRGWREAVVRGDAAVGRAAGAYAALALVVALAGYAVMHGAPF